MEDLERYAWVDDWEVVDAGCVSVATAATESEVLAAFGFGSDSASRLVRGTEAFDLQTDGTEVVVQIETLDGVVVVFEPNGFQGSGHDLALQLSARGRYVAYFWNANAVTELVYAEGGELLRSFEPLLYGNDGEPERALPVEHRLPFDEFGADRRSTKTGRSCLMLIERLTGARIEREWLLDRPRATYRRPGGW